MTTQPTAVRPAIADVYGRAYLWLEATGGRPGLTELTYELEDGTSYQEDAAVYFGGTDSWFPPDVLACELAVGRVLDIGCGAGRHSLALAGAGHEVVGLEPSADAVAVARRRGVDARPGSLPEPPDGLGTFDTFLLLGANLALLTTYPWLHTALDRLAALARPGAQLLGTDIALSGAQQVSHLRVRATHQGEDSGWSAWEGGQPYLPPDRLADAVRGSAWTVEAVHHDAEDGYLARLRLT